MSPITVVQTVLPAGHKPPQQARLLESECRYQRLGTGDQQGPYFCSLVKKHFHTTLLPRLPLVISMMHGSRPSSEYLRWRLKFIPAVPPPAKGDQQAHHQVFYKQKQCPVVPFHRLTLNTPPLCALFVSNNAPIQQQQYKSECHNKKRHNSSKLSGLCCSIYIVFMCFSLPPFLSLALLWCSGLADCCTSKSVRLHYRTH